MESLILYGILNNRADSEYYCFFTVLDGIAPTELALKMILDFGLVCY